VNAPTPLPPIRILVVEDSEPDFELLRATLARQGVEAEYLRVEEREAMAGALATGRWDVVISDHQLPRFSSSEALQTLRDSGRTLPFLIVSGAIGEDVAVEAMRAGADDYLIKGRLARLGAALRRALSDARARRERAEAQAALRESEERLRQLSAHLQSAVEQERRAIAREVHDDIGGMLTGLRFDLGWIERHSEGEVAARARQALEVVGQVMQASQRIMRNLRPPVLEAGIVAALDWQAAQFRRRTGLPCQFTSNVASVALDEGAALTVHRTAQEALTNVIKHARASRVRIDLVVSGGMLSLEVTDDGAGVLADDLLKPGSFGLRGLAERARAAGGWIDVLPAERGTSVLLSLPIDGRPVDEARDEA
jgi:signal transduction histidine kinase